MAIGLFIDAAYARKSYSHDSEAMDYTKLRSHIEQHLNDKIDVAYFFNADTDPPKAAKFHNFLAYPPPKGPGFRVKTYWLQKKVLFWPKSLGGYPIVHPDNPELQYELTTQKAVDVGLVFHMIRSHSKRRWDKLVLVAGDGDFHEPVQELVESDNVDLFIVGSMNSISEELRPYAKEIIEIDQEPLHSQLKL